MTLPDEITAAIPHRPPMLLVDAVVERNENSIHGRKVFRPDEFFFQGHYPGAPIVPGVILCEAGMQCGALLVASQIPSHPDVGIPVATRLNQVKFKQIIRPGDLIDIHVDLVERLADAYFMKARIRCRDKLAASFEFACTVTRIAS